LKFYNIHNIIKVCSNKELERLNYFEVKNLQEEKLDIIVEFGKFRSKIFDFYKLKENYRWVNKHWIGNHSLFCFNRHKFSFWEVWIEGLDQQKTTIHFDGDSFFSKKIFFVLIFEPFLTYKLLQKKTLLLHSSSLSFNGEGSIFSGGTGVGKTSILLNLLRNKKTKYFADDQSIIKNSTLYSYPIPIGLRSHLVYNNKLKMSSKDTAIILLHNLVNLVTFYYGNLTHRVFAKNIGFCNSREFIETGDSVPLKNVFILTLGEPPKVEQITPEQALTFLLHHNRQNEDKQQIISRYFEAYKKIYPEFNYWVHLKKRLQKFVHSPNINFYKVQLNKKYHVNENLKKILKIMEN